MKKPQQPETIVEKLQSMISEMEQKSFLFAQVEPDVIPNIYDQIVGILLEAAEKVQDAETEFR